MIIRHSRYLICPLLLLQFSTTYSQTNDEIGLTRFRNHIISLPKDTGTNKLNATNRHITVADVRFDTSCIGIIKKGNNVYPTFLKFEAPTTKVIEDYFASLIGSDPMLHQADFCCYVKKLMLSDEIYVTPEGSKVSSTSVDFLTASGIMLTIEFYAKQNNFYFPLYRFDTILTGKKQIFSAGEDYIASALRTSLRRLRTTNMEKIRSQSKKLSRHEIDSFYSSRTELPILSEDCRKGIYYTFNDFRKNAPVDRYFTVKKDDKGDFLYVKDEKGEDMLLTDLWGYCDGKDIFVFSAENYFKLYRSNNSFKIYGAKGFTTVRDLRLNFGLLDAAIPNSTYAKSKTAARHVLKKSWYLLDMDTGELY